MYCFRPGRDSSASVHPLPIGNPSNGFLETRILDSRIGRNQQSGWSARFNSRSLERVGGVDCRGLMKKMGREVNGCRRDVSWWNYWTIVRNRDRVLLVAGWSLSSMFVSFRIVERILSMLLCVGIVDVVNHSGRNDCVGTKYISYSLECKGRICCIEKIIIQGENC